MFAVNGWFMLRGLHITLTQHQTHIVIIECTTCTLCSSGFTYLWSIVSSENVQLCEPVLCYCTSLVAVQPTTQYIDISAV